MYKKIMIMVMFVGMMSFCGYAQETNVEEVVPEQEVVLEATEVAEDGIVSLDFRDADIQNVLRILSYKSGVNIVTGPEVTGMVTIKLKDVPWQQALNVILETYGYSYEQKGNIITVTTIENLKQRREDALLLAEQEPLATKTFILNYAKAPEVIVSIDKMKTSRGSVNYDERTNALIVRDIAGNLELMEGVIKELDRPTPQILIETKIIEASFTDSEELGLDWTTNATISGSTRPNVWPFTTASDNKYLPDNIPSTTTGFSYGTLDFSELKTVIKFLFSKTDTNILSNPRIVTLDNKTASIKVGEMYPFATKTFNKDTGTWEFNEWRYEDIGITFDVTPHVNSAGFITVQIEPKVTEILEIIEDPGSGSRAPKLSNETVSTNVMIKDGETLVIGGLIKDKVVDTKKKTPFLGDIPLFGLLFQKTEKATEKKDILIFLTPHIVTYDEALK